MDKLVTVSTCKDLLQHPLNQTTKICQLSCFLIKPKCPEGISDNTRGKFKHRAWVYAESVRNHVAPNSSPHVQM